MRSRLRQLVFCMMYYLGLFRLLRFIRRNHIVILKIHGVMDDSDRPSWEPLRPQLSRSKLDGYLKILSRRYRFVSLMSAIEMLQERRPMQPYSLVLTFDDGYRNNFTHALPILRRYNAPATFFIATGFADAPKPFWCDRLDYALQHAQVSGREVRVGSLTMRLDGSSRETLRKSYERLRRTGKSLQMSDHNFLRDMEQIAAQLEAESGKALGDIQQDDDWSAVAAWEDIQKNQDESVTIGSHTVGHIRLGLVEANVVFEELTQSKWDIENCMGKPCFSICYPNGSFTDEVITIAKDCNYLCGLTTEEGLNCVGHDVMKLRRMNVPSNVSGTELLARVCGFSQGLSRFTERLKRGRWS